MKNLSFLATLALIIVSNSALAGLCKLNIRGDSICLGAQALYQAGPSENKGAKPQFKIVKVKDIMYPKVALELGEKIITASVDDISPSQKCSDGRHVCKGDRIEIVEDCAAPERDNARVESVFRNEMILVRAKGSFFGKTERFIMPVHCVDSVL